MSNPFSPLEGWLARRTPDLPFLDPKRTPNLKDGTAGIIFDIVRPIHTATILKPQSLQQSWQAIREYTTKALEVINADTPLGLDREEVEMIDEALGPPPPQCYPLYMITVTEPAGRESCVYIGKTSSGRNRFAGGHAAFTKLHDPAYSSHRKNIYLACITLLDEDVNYIPLEFVTPLATAEKILKSVEAQMIYELQPALNTQQKKKYNCAFPLILQIQNFTSDYLKDTFLYPPAQP